MVSLWNWIGQMLFENCTTSYNFSIRFVATATTITATTTVHNQHKAVATFSLFLSLLLRIYGVYVSQSKDKQISDMSIEFFLFLKNKWLLCLHFTLDINACFAFSTAAALKWSSSTAATDFRFAIRRDPFHCNCNWELPTPMCVCVHAVETVHTAMHDHTGFPVVHNETWNSSSILCKQTYKFNNFIK